MAKLSSNSITIKDLSEFLSDYSDFSFEIRVLKLLMGVGFTCEHGGTYDDPVTDRPRQFDIRATRRFVSRFVRLAVECKNLRPKFPFLVSCVPRADEESFYEVALSVDLDRYSLADEEPSSGPTSRAMLPRTKNIRLTGDCSMYAAGLPVGKSCDQVGRTPQGEISASSADVYEKWAQALSSADDLTYLACNEAEYMTDEGLALSLVFPIVVVPNTRLWTAQYDDAGSLIGSPTQADRCSYFVGKSYSHRGHTTQQLTLSHLEFVTVEGLSGFINSLCGTEADVNRCFEVDVAKEVRARRRR